MPGYGRRKDANHDAIAEAFRALGWQVWDTYQHAAYTPGWPDLICLRRGRVLFVEVKTPGEALTDAEGFLRDTVLWHHGEYHVVSTSEEAVAVIRMSEEMRKETG